MMHKLFATVQNSCCLALADRTTCCLILILTMLLTCDDTLSQLLKTQISNIPTVSFKPIVSREYI